MELEIASAELDLAAGDPRPAQERMQALLAIGAPRAGHQGWRIQHILATAALIQEDGDATLEHAAGMIEKSLGNDRPAALAALVKSRAALLAGNDDHAAELAHHALATFAEHGWDAGAIDAIEVVGAIAATQGSSDYAARLICAATAARSERGLVRIPPDPSFWDPIEARIRAEASAAATEAGAQLTLADAITYARRGRGSRDRPLRGWESLTPTENEVARLAAEGLTNPQIADQLFISRSTVKYHLAHVYGKLDIGGRTELAGIAAAHEPHIWPHAPMHLGGRR